MRGTKTIHLWKNKSYRESQCKAMQKHNIDIGILKERYLNGEATTTLSKDYGCSVWTIISRLNKAGITKFRKGFQKGHKHSGMLGKKLSEEHKEKIKKSQLGEKNNNWKGGVTPEEHVFRMSSVYNEWRKKVYRRDNYTCQECGERGKNLEAHHIKTYAEHKHLRIEINNGITLCKDCHMKTKTKEYLFENKYTRLIKMKNNKLRGGYRW